VSNIAGFMSIGRTPRPDIVNDVQACLGRRITIVERGALDQIADDTLADLAPGQIDDALIASLGDGQEAVVSKAKVAALLQVEIERLEKEVDAFVILCTGPFPSFRSKHKVAQVGALLFDAVRAKGIPDRLGVLMPIAEQERLNRRLWTGYGKTIETAVASPYQGIDGVIAAAEQMAAAGVDLVAMSCMGYSEAMRQAVIEATSVPAVGPGQVLADYLAEGP
jgi:protein AroM|tara:strand:- start:1881 stop:2546 length:666 start_codon:yes stop_codon:yes gene_type:complete